MHKFHFTEFSLTDQARDQLLEAVRPVMSKYSGSEATDTKGELVMDERDLRKLRIAVEKNLPQEIIEGLTDNSPQALRDPILVHNLPVREKEYEYPNDTQAQRKSHFYPSYYIVQGIAAMRQQMLDRAVTLVRRPAHPFTPKEGVLYPQYQQRPWGTFIHSDSAHFSAFAGEQNLENAPTKFIDLREMLSQPDASQRFSGVYLTERKLVKSMLEVTDTYNLGDKDDLQRLTAPHKPNLVLEVNIAESEPEALNRFLLEMEANSLHKTLHKGDMLLFDNQSLLHEALPGKLESIPDDHLIKRKPLREINVYTLNKR